MNYSNILVIGGAGYIGSRLIQHLMPEYKVSSFDFCKFSDCMFANEKRDYATIQRSDLQDFATVILLAGHSSVRMCDGLPSGVMKNNVLNFVRLVDLLNEDQTLIYASSASVYGNCKQDQASENTPFDLPYNMYDMTKQAIDSYAISSKFLTRRIFGFRFGTVNGYSPILRDDVMLNAMTSAAWNEGKVNLYSANTRRSILGIGDLCRATTTVLQSNRANGGIYNLCSFTSTSGQMANAVSESFGVPVNHVVVSDAAVAGKNEKLVSSKYDFSLDCSKFCRDFDFSFSETIQTILLELDSHRGQMLHTNRNTPFDYEWSSI